MTNYNLYEFQIEGDRTFKKFDCIWPEEDHEALRKYESIINRIQFDGIFSNLPYIIHSKNVGSCEFCYDRIMGSCTEEHNLCKTQPTFLLEALIKRGRTIAEDLHFNVSPYSPIMVPLNSPVVSMSKDNIPYVYYLTSSEITPDNFLEIRDELLHAIIEAYEEAKVLDEFSELRWRYVSLNHDAVDASIHYFSKIKPSLLLFQNYDFVGGE